jgi:hypothetical protein
MMLGELIWRMDDPDMADKAIGAIRDASLLRRVEAAAAAADMLVGEYVASSVRTFANTAGDEAWIALIGKCQAHTDPGLTALTYMLETRLRAEEAHAGGHSSPERPTDC